MEDSNVSKEDAMNHIRQKLKLDEEVITYIEEYWKE